MALLTSLPLSVVPKILGADPVGAGAELQPHVGTDEPQNDPRPPEPAAVAVGEGVEGDRRAGDGHEPFALALADDPDARRGAGVAEGDRAGQGAAVEGGDDVRHHGGAVVVEDLGRSEGLDVVEVAG